MGKDKWAEGAEVVNDKWAQGAEEVAPQAQPAVRGVSIPLRNSQGVMTPKGLDVPMGTGATAATAPLRVLAGGAEQAGQGYYTMAHPQSFDDFAGGASNAIRGTGTLALPFAAPGMVAHPLATLFGTGVAAGVGGAVETGSKMMGVGPGKSELAGTLSGGAAGLAAGYGAAQVSRAMGGGISKILTQAKGNRKLQDALTELIPVYGKKAVKIRAALDPPPKAAATARAPKGRAPTKAERDASARSLDPYTYPAPSSRIGMPAEPQERIQARKQPYRNPDAHPGVGAAGSPDYYGGLPAPPAVAGTPGPLQYSDYYAAGEATAPPPAPSSGVSRLPAPPRPIKGTGVGSGPGEYGGAPAPGAVPTPGPAEYADYYGQPEPVPGPVRPTPPAAPPRVPTGPVDKYGNPITPGIPRPPAVSMEYEVSPVKGKASGKGGGEPAAEPPARINPTAEEIAAQVEKFSKPAPATETATPSKSAVDALADELKQGSGVDPSTLVEPGDLVSVDLDRAASVAKETGQTSTGILLGWLHSIWQRAYDTTGRATHKTLSEAMKTKYGVKSTLEMTDKQLLDEFRATQKIAIEKRRAAGLPKPPE